MRLQSAGCACGQRRNWQLASVVPVRMYVWRFHPGTSVLSLRPTAGFDVLVRDARCRAGAARRGNASAAGAGPCGRERARRAGQRRGGRRQRGRRRPLLHAPRRGSPVRFSALDDTPLLKNVSCCNCGPAVLCREKAQQSAWPSIEHLSLSSQLPHSRFTGFSIIWQARRP